MIVLSDNVVWKMVTVNGKLWPSYQAPSNGDIRSLNRPKIVNRRHKGAEYTTKEIWNLKGKLLKRIYSANGVPCVHLYSEDRTVRRISVSVKRIVAETFLPRGDYAYIPTQRIVNIDGDAENCSVENIMIKPPGGMIHENSCV